MLWHLSCVLLILLGSTELKSTLGTMAHILPSKACTQAEHMPAGAEVDTTKQRGLLKAACFGVAFCRNYPNTKLFTHCQRLRVLNAVRDPSVGMPLTMVQMDSLTLPVVVSRYRAVCCCHVGHVNEVVPLESLKC